MQHFTLNLNIYSSLFISFYFTVNMWRFEQLFSATSPQTSQPLPLSYSLSSLVIPPFQMTVTYWVFGHEVVANLTLGPHYFLKHVPTLKWLVCAKNAAKHGDLSLCEGKRWSGRWGKAAKVLAAHYYDVSFNKQSFYLCVSNPGDNCGTCYWAVLCEK